MFTLLSICFVVYVAYQEGVFKKFIDNYKEHEKKEIFNSRYCMFIGKSFIINNKRYVFDEAKKLPQFDVFKCKNGGYFQIEWKSQSIQPLTKEQAQNIYKDYINLYPAKEHLYKEIFNETYNTIYEDA